MQTTTATADGCYLVRRSPCSCGIRYESAIDANGSTVDGTSSTAINAAVHELRHGVQRTTDDGHRTRARTGARY